MLKTVRLRFETHFDIHDQLILLNSTQNNCPGIFAKFKFSNGNVDI